MSIWPAWIVALYSAGMFLASIGMFWVGWRNYKLYEQERDQAKQQQKDFEDLLEAIVISTLISGPSSTGDLDKAKNAFKENYKGQRQIFKDRA